MAAELQMVQRRLTEEKQKVSYCIVLYYVAIFYFILLIMLYFISLIMLHFILLIMLCLLCYIMLYYISKLSSI